MENPAERFISSASEYREHLLQAYLVARLLTNLPLDEMREMQLHAESAGPIVDPSGYIRHAKALREDSDVVDVLARARRELKKRLPALVALSGA